MSNTLQIFVIKIWSNCSRESVGGLLGVHWGPSGGQRGIRWGPSGGSSGVHRGAPSAGYWGSIRGPSGVRQGNRRGIRWGIRRSSSVVHWKGPSGVHRGSIRGSLVLHGGVRWWSVKVFFKFCLSLLGVYWESARSPLVTKFGELILKDLQIETWCLLQ